MEAFIAYYRVSTQRQGLSGLGLEAQKSSVLSFLNNRTILAEFTDVETGKNDNRPQLLKAIEQKANKFNFINCEVRGFQGT